MSNQFGSAAVDIVGLLDDVVRWAGEATGHGMPVAYGASLLSDDVRRLVDQAASRAGWIESSARERMDVLLIDGSQPEKKPANAGNQPAAARLHVFFAFSDIAELASDELLAGYSQFLKANAIAATCIASSDGGALALAVITGEEGDPAAWWNLLDALNTFGSFKIAHLSRLNRRMGEVLKKAAILSDEMLDEVVEHNTARFRERHSLKEISRNLKHEVIHHRLRKGARRDIATKESYFRLASGKLLKEAGALIGKPKAEAGLLQTLVLGAVSTRCGLYISEDHTFGGLEQWVCDFARDLRPHGYMPYLIVLGSPSLDSRVAEQFPGDVIYLGGNGASLPDVVSRCRLESLIVNHVYDGLDNVPTSCRVLEVLHNIYFWHVGDTKVLDARKHVDCFVAVSGEVSRYSSEYLNLPSEKLRTVTHGLNNVDLYRPPMEYLRKIRSNMDEFRVLCVGNLYPQKNLICLVEAFAMLKERVPGARLLLAGALAEGGYVEAIRATIRRLGLADSVDMLGSLDRRALSREYAHAHMFAFPSLYEGYGLVNLEAAYFGLPMVMSNTGYAVELAAQSSACRLASIAMPHAELGRDAVAERSHSPAPEAVKELHAQMSAIHSSYARAMEEGLSMIDRPPFPGVGEAADAMRKLLTSA